MDTNSKRALLLLGGLAAVVAAVALIVFIVGLLGFDVGPLARQSEDRTLTLLYWQAPSTLNPYLSGGFKDRDAGAVTLEPLAKYDPDGALVPALAARIPTLANGGVSADLTTITWTLRSDLSWSDGSDLTAHDAVFTWQYCTDEATGCTASGAFSDVVSVEALDDVTVRVRFHDATPYPYTAFVGTGAPIISRAQFADCVGAAASGCEEENFGPLGAGPYRVVDFTPDEVAVYERNPHYYGDKPYFDKVVLRGGGDATSAAQAVLEDGTADYAWNLQIDPGALARMEVSGTGTVVSAFASLVERIVLNQTNADPVLGEDRSEYLGGANPHPLLTFTPIAQAMSMAIDRSLISGTLYGSAGEPTCNLIEGPPTYVSTANDGCLQQDIEGANALLDANGVVDTDGDGIREHNGVPLRLVFQTSTNDGATGYPGPRAGLVAADRHRDGDHPPQRGRVLRRGPGGGPRQRLQPLLRGRADVRNRPGHRPAAVPLRPDVQRDPERRQQLGRQQRHAGVRPRVRCAG